MSKQATETDSRLTLFVDLFNLCYPDWEVNGRTSNSLQPHHVDFDTNLRKYWGRCGPRKNGQIYYRINDDYWNDNGWPDRIALMLHEMAHTHETNHSPDFWQHVIDSFHTLDENREIVESIIGTGLDWAAIKRAIVTDPKSNTVDNRSETAYERRVKIANAIDYPVDELSPFSGTSFYTVAYPNHEFCRHIPTENIEFEKEYDTDELIDLLHSRPRPGISYQNNAYHIDPPKVRREGKTYYVIEGEDRAALATKAVVEQSRKRDSIPAIVTNVEDSE